MMQQLYGHWLKNVCTSESFCASRCTLARLLFSMSTWRHKACYAPKQTAKHIKHANYWKSRHIISELYSSAFSRLWFKEAWLLCFRPVGVNSSLFLRKSFINQIHWPNYCYTNQHKCPHLFRQMLLTDVDQNCFKVCCFSSFRMTIIAKPI